MRFLLVGNPNVGKTTLFNALTAGTERVGNWSGVTVAEKEGIVQCGHQQISLTDLPGIYSLDGVDTKQKDETLALETIAARATDGIVQVLDANQLERNLYLTSQLLELERPIVLVLTMLDKAAKRGIQIDMQQLSEQLGCPVFDGSRGMCLDTLKQTMISTLPVPKPLLLHLTPLDTEDEALRVLDARYRAIHALILKVETRQTAAREQLTAKLDRVLLHRFLAFPIFFAVMYFIFFLVMTVGGYFQASLVDLFDAHAVPSISFWLHQLGCQERLTTWIIHGLGFGIATTLSFMPVIGMMYFLLGCLEESGYMARVAFIMDKLMRFLGLPGKAFVPLIVGFGCNVPAVMATRTLDSSRERQLAMLMTPFMSCGARLTIFTAFVTVFFPINGYNMVFSLYCIGIGMALLTGLLLRNTLFSGPISPLLLELPAYQLPHWPLLGLATLRKLNAFLWRAGKLIVPICMLISLLNVIPIDAHDSCLSWMSRLLQPIFAPMGISAENWPAVVGLMTGMLAKEVVIGTLNSLYASMGGLSQMFNGVSAYAYLLFVLLYVPCASTMAVLRTEGGRFLMWLSIGWSTTLAYVTAVSFYQLATFQQHPGHSLIWLAAVIVFASFLFVRIRAGRFWMGGKHAVRAS